ncbi:GntR family transcriptional regulator [Amycolatopsis roodepoortensis]|uniref:GntR family transcriptional regulator n=1 Tax=Amycolatopsis roodepoortensis TaxID=700274 RepID=UPI00214CC201|nr:GntR family transcriptional regulator [Amycolatopsis roodepoortensis]UUV32210.1 GntR family transcriptional regulator [Amycolatopsis roodepoortensis]
MVVKKPTYEVIAANLRGSIVDGTHPPGDTLPPLSQLTRQFGASKETVQKAVRLLIGEGLVETRRGVGGGTVVTAAPAREVIVRQRKIFRDERGYFFDLAAQPWVAIRDPQVRTAPPPADIAVLLGTAPGQPVVIRDRVMGDPDTLEVRHVSLSYLPPWLVDELPVIAETDTGPGGIYDRMEEHLQAQLRMEERIGARQPSAQERELWPLPPGTSMLRLRRIARGPDERICEVNETVLPGHLFEIGYTLERADTPDR